MRDSTKGVDMRLMVLAVTVSLVVALPATTAAHAQPSGLHSEAAPSGRQRSDYTLRVKLRGLTGHQTQVTLRSLQRPRFTEIRRTARSIAFRHLTPGRYQLSVEAVDNGDELLRPRRSVKDVKIGIRNSTTRFRFESLDRMVLNQPFATDIRESPLAGEPRSYYTRSSAFPKDPAAWHLPVDGEGAVVIHKSGALHNHPVSQAQYGLTALASYDLTGDDDYLAIARAQAIRLLQARVEVGKAFYFPYTFRWRLGVTGRNYRPNWYSAMAQGQALSLFLRLAEVTGEMQWRDAADHVFASLLRQPVDAEDIAVVHVHEGHLWLEEYPRYPVEDSGHVYNGLMFATFGVYDYYLATGNPQALLLLRGALQTVKDMFARVRNPGGYSHYSIHGNRPHELYHRVHIRQLQYLSEVTGDSEFARMAETLRDDSSALEPDDAVPPER